MLILGDQKVSFWYDGCMDEITYVDENDKVIGYGTREDAITNGIIHRIARVFVFNTKGQLLIQLRSPDVDLAGKWDQSAAGHVDKGEDYPTAAAREANEEIGLPVMPMKEIGVFYSEEIDNGIMKKRFNGLYSLTYDGELHQDNDEVSEVRWVGTEELSQWMKEKPEDFTQGFLQTYNYYLQQQF
jgi:isopentenyldiphosphate isomerase